MFLYVGRQTSREKKMSQEEILPLTLINEGGKHTHMHTKVPDDIINEKKVGRVSTEWH